MYTQHSTMKMGRPVALDEDGPTVRLLAQTQDHKVVFAGPSEDGETLTVPASEFFQCFREATAEEIHDFEHGGGDAPRLALRGRNELVPAEETEDENDPPPQTTRSRPRAAPTV
jgi:hypothetical protein